MRLSLQSGFAPSWGRPQKALQPGVRQATVLAVAAQKGGVGKTTTTVSLAAALARFHGLHVLVVDLDPQAHVSHALRGMVETGGSSLGDLLVEPLGQEVHEIATTTRIPGLMVTPADPELSRAESQLATRIGKELVLREALEVTRTWHDVILLDCPPNVGNLTLNGLVAADRVIVPCNPAVLAVSGVEGLISTVAEVRSVLNPRLDVLGLVLTRVDGRTEKMNEAIVAMMEESWPGMLLPVQIGVDNALSRAQFEGKDVFDFDPSSRAATHYRALADCVLERIQCVSR